MTMTKNSGSDQENKKQPATQEAPALTNQEILQKLSEVQSELTAMKAQPQAVQNSGSGLNDLDIAKIAAIIAQTQKALVTKDPDYENGVQEEDVPLEDWDEKGVRFCCPLVGYLIQDDIRKGHRVKLPYNKKEVFFNYAATRITGVGKHNQTAAISVFRSNSHKLTKWLREHTLYGSMFYETSTEAINSDASKALRMASIMRHLQSLEVHDLFRRCKDYGLDASEDAGVMRGKIAYAMIEKEIETEATRSKMALDDTYKSTLLLGRE